MLRTSKNLRTTSITALLIATSVLATGCAHTNDLIVVRQTAERVKYFTTPQGEQYVKELIHFHSMKR